MGCDIHCFVEKRSKSNKWEKITGFISNFYDPDDKYFSKKKYRNADSPIYSGNYRMFAILADVRNGIGFAGCDTGDRIEPISEPNGIPSDVCDEIRQEIESWDSDGHSHSYLTAKEISDYDKTITVKERGYVTCNEYKFFLENGYPESWCGGVSGGDVIKVCNDNCIKFQKDNPDMNVYTKIEWSMTAEQLAPWLFGDCLKQLMERSDTGTGDDVRIVFWFDN